MRALVGSLVALTLVGCSFIANPASRYEFCEDDRIQQIAAGRDHTCSLRACGLVECWGGGLLGPARRRPAHCQRDSGPGRGADERDRYRRLRPLLLCAHH